MILNGVFLGQSLTAFMRHWNVSVDSTVTPPARSNPNLLSSGKSQSSLLLNVLSRKRKCQLYVQNGPEEFGEHKT